MPKYCRGDRFLEEDGNCGLIFLPSIEPPSRLGNLTFETPPKFFEDVLFESDCIGMDLLTEGFEPGR